MKSREPSYLEVGRKRRKGLKMRVGEAEMRMVWVVLVYGHRKTVEEAGRPSKMNLELEERGL